MSTGQHAVQPEAVRSTVGNVGALLVRATGAVLELEEMFVEPTAFAVIGRPVAAANAQLRGREVRALRGLLARVRQISEDLGRYAAGSTSDEVAPTLLWSDSAAGRLAGHAIADGAGRADRAGAVRAVLGYFTAAGLLSEGAESAAVPTGSTAEFADWLDSSPDNQAVLGLIAIYAGQAGDFGDVPGAIRDGDLAIVAPGPDAAGRAPIIGIMVAGNPYNRGMCKPDFGGMAKLRIYRPLGDSAGGGR